MATERLDTVPEPNEPRALIEGGATTPVVANLDNQHALANFRIDVDFGSRSVLDRISQRLGDHVVGGELDLFGQSLVYSDVEADRDGGRRASALSASFSPPSASTGG